MEQAKHDKVNETHAEPVQSAAQVQAVFVATLVFIVLSVVAEYFGGEFIGRNLGGDFSVVIGGALAFAIIVGLAIGAVQFWNRQAHRH